MLKLRKKSLFSTTYLVEEDGSVISEIKGWLSNGRGDFTVEGKHFRLEQTGTIRSTFTLFEDNTSFVEARLPSVVSQDPVFDYGDGRYEIRILDEYSAQLIGRAGVVLGHVRVRNRWFFTGAIAQLPASLPPSIRVFIVWTAMCLWLGSWWTAQGSP